MDPNIPDLLPGDACLYKPSGFFGWLIRLKTWHSISHIEIYEGNGFSVASRDGKGVARYPFRSEGLCRVMRPNGFYSHESAQRWFRYVDGQKYDWLGILCFTLAVKQGAMDKMFCSEFATRWYRSAGLEPFNAKEDADKIAPFQFTTSPRLDEVWRKD